MNATPDIMRRVITAADLRGKDLGEIVALPSVSFDTMVGGSLEGFRPDGERVHVTVSSRSDGELSGYWLSAEDEVVVYDGARAKQDALRSGIER